MHIHNPNLTCCHQHFYSNTNSTQNPALNHKQNITKSTNQEDNVLAILAKKTSLTETQKTVLRKDSRLYPNPNT